MRLRYSEIETWKGRVNGNDGRNWRGGRRNLARVGRKWGNDAGQTEERSEGGRAAFRLGDRMAGARRQNHVDARETIFLRVPQGEAITKGKRRGAHWNDYDSDPVRLGSAACSACLPLVLSKSKPDRLKPVLLESRNTC